MRGLITAFRRRCARRRRDRPGAAVLPSGRASIMTSKARKPYDVGVTGDGGVLCACDRCDVLVECSMCKAIPSVIGV